MKKILLHQVIQKTENVEYNKDKGTTAYEVVEQYTET